MPIQLHETYTADVGCWDEGFEVWPLAVSVPKGLEGACAGIARREGQLRLQPFCPGILKAHKTPPGRLMEAMRIAPIWSFGSFVIICTVAAQEVQQGRALSDTVAAIDAAVSQFNLGGVPYWLDCPKTETAASRKLAAQLLACETLSIPNSPSDYRLTLKLVSDQDKIHVLLGPSISVKKRFPYRRQDVGASINPVLAAAMVRLAPPVEGGIVIDPTCGSGTLLAERLAYSGETEALGIDISSRAEAAFNANLSSTGAAGSFCFRLGDGADAANWQACRTVVANLPFGIRVRQPRAELESLYRGVLDNTVAFLERDGRVILTSSFKSLLDSVFDRRQDRLRILARYRAEMGGLVYQIVVAAKS